MVTTAGIRGSALAPVRYTAPTIDLDSRRVGQEEWGILILLGVVALGTLAYASYCTFNGGDSSFNFSLTGVSGSCN